MSQPYRLGTVAFDDCDRAALFVEDYFYDLSALAQQTGNAAVPAGTLEILQSWSQWEPQLVELAGELATGDIPVDPLRGSVRLRPPVPRPGKVIGVGANYRDHREEMGADDFPERPYLFLKPASTTQIGSGEPLSAPRRFEWVDWEAELAVIIGALARDIGAEDVPGVIAGYAVANDVSARDSLSALMPQLGVDWLEHKGSDGFTPIGPAMTPAAFVPDPQDLAIKLHVNGVLKQDASTALMVTSVNELVAHISTVTTLEPGDVILTGTPAGVGFARTPREKLTPGDEVVVEIDGLGTLVTPVV